VLSKISSNKAKETPFFDGFEKAVLTCKSQSSLEKLINGRLIGLDKYKFLRKYDEMASLVLVTPIYTQLVYQQILILCSRIRSNGYPEHLINFIESYMQEKLVEIIKRFNQNIVRVTKEYLVVLSDIFQDRSDSEFMRNTKKIIDNKEAMDKLYKEYQSDYGFGMGDAGLFLLNDLINEVEREWLIWPFSSSIDMVVELAIYKK